MAGPSIVSRAATERPLSAVLPALAVITVYLFCNHSILLFYWSFICGSISVHYLLRNRQLNECTAFGPLPQCPLKDVGVKAHCLTCGKTDCCRHRPSMDVLSQQPWWNVVIPERVDRAVEEFFGILLDKCFYDWYSNISDDESLAIELKKALRFFTAVLLKRLDKADIPCILQRKIIPEFIKHIVVSMRSRRRYSADNSTVAPEDLAKKCYNSNLHYAVLCKEHSSEYVRAVLDKVLPRILSEETLHCVGLTSLLREILSEMIILPALDKISNPHLLNSLLLIFLDKEPPPQNHLPLTRPTVLLKHFSCSPHPSDSDDESNCLRHSLLSVLQDQLLLVKFMDFMRSKGAINYLQLFLSADSFKNEYMKMPSQPEDVKALRRDAMELYTSYMIVEALDRVVQLDDTSIVSAFRLVNNGNCDFYSICTTDLVNRVYDFSRNLLEDTFLPEFLSSSQYFGYWYGQKSSLQRERGVSWKPDSSVQMRKLSSKGKGVFGGEKHMKELEEPYAGLGAAAESTPDEDIVDQSILEELRNLQDWRVEIPSVSIRLSPRKPAPNYLYQVTVLRGTDVSSISVYRKCNDFYKLDQKLKEFHGSASDLQLPPKRVFIKKDEEYYDSIKPQLEEYLKSLLERPELKNSELLHCFLVDENFQGRSLPDIHIENVIKSVPLKLAMERGQNLSPFLRHFLSSAVMPKLRTSISRTQANGETPINPATRRVSTQQTCWSLEDAPSSSTDHPPSSSSVNGTSANMIFAYVTYVADELFQVSKTFHNALMALGLLLEGVLDRALVWYLGQKVALVTQEHRVEAVIHLLQDALFSPDPVDENGDYPSKENEHQRRQRALQELQSFLPDVFWYFFHKETVAIKLEQVFQALQQPQLNKQLAFVLFDVLMEELFDELLVPV